VILELTATIAIVVQDRAPLHASPAASSPTLTSLWQGDVLEIRGERAGYLKVYDYRRERGGFLKEDTVRVVGLTESDAAELLAVLRFLRDTPGSEALGISYGAAYLKAAPAAAVSAEPLDAIARMAERLADQASGRAADPVVAAAHVEVVQQFGIRMKSFERQGRMQMCYDGDLYRRVLSQTGASDEERARAALGLTRTDCIDPNLGPVPRAAVDEEREQLLETINEEKLSPLLRSRLHARRAGVLAAIAFEQAHRREPAAATAQRALNEVLSVHADELGDDRRAEYQDAMLRVGAMRWAAQLRPVHTGFLALTAAPGQPGQTCVTLKDSRQPKVAAVAQRCTYGIVWLASAQSFAQDQALVLAVQPLESWRELWVFHARAGGWTVDVLSPGLNEPEEGYVDFAGFAPGTRRLLLAREVKDHGRFRRRFEELRLDDLALVHQASTPELLPDFGRWQDVDWRRESFALR